MDDARLNVALVQTALFHGATLLNYMSVDRFLFDHQKRANGAVLRDVLTGREYAVQAKIIVNATGPFTYDTERRCLGDLQRHLGQIRTDPTSPPPMMASPKEDSTTTSRGAHIVLPSYYAPAKMGLLDPKTPDGRVLFFLPWLGNTLAGTTDVPQHSSASVLLQEQGPKTPPEDVDFIVGNLSKFLSMPLLRSDILATWSGLRPLASSQAPTMAGDAVTESKDVVRSHQVDVCDVTGLVSIRGGKWTTFRVMAQDTIDCCVQALQQRFGVQFASSHAITPSTLDSVANGSSTTDNVKLVGAHGFRPLGYVQLVQYLGLPTDIAEHVHRSYGDRALHVLLMSPSRPSSSDGHAIFRRLHDKYPYLEQEVRYAVRQEHAQRISDVLGRRTRLAFLSVQAARQCLPRVLDIMAEELHWTNKQRLEARDEAEQYLTSCGLMDVQPARGQFTVTQWAMLRALFGHDPSRRIPLVQLKKGLPNVGHEAQDSPSSPSLTETEAVSLQDLLDWLDRSHSTSS